MERRAFSASLWSMQAGFDESTAVSYRSFQDSSDSVLCRLIRMLHSITNFGRLVDHIIISVVLMILGWLDPAVSLNVAVPLLGPTVSLSLPFNNSTLVRVVLFVLAAACFA